MSTTFARDSAADDKPLSCASQRFLHATKHKRRFSHKALLIKHHKAILNP